VYEPHRILDPEEECSKTKVRLVKRGSSSECIFPYELFPPFLSLTFSGSPFSRRGGIYLPFKDAVHEATAPPSSACIFIFLRSIWPLSFWTSFMGTYPQLRSVLRPVSVFLFPPAFPRPADFFLPFFCARFLPSRVPLPATGSLLPPSEQVRFFLLPSFSPARPFSSLLPRSPFRSGSSFVVAVPSTHASSSCRLFPRPPLLFLAARRPGTTEVFFFSERNCSLQHTHVRRFLFLSVIEAAGPLWFAGRNDTRYVPTSLCDTPHSLLPPTPAHTGVLAFSF